MSHCEQEGKGKIKLTVKKLCKTLTVEIYLVPNAYLLYRSYLNSKCKTWMLQSHIKCCLSVKKLLTNWEKKRRKICFFLLDLCENHLLIMRRNSYDPFKMSVLFCQQPIIKCCLTVMKLLTNWQRKRKKNCSSSIHAKIG